LRAVDERPFPSKRLITRSRQLARYGLLGERWADSILNGMFTTSSYYSVQYITDSISEAWNESIDAGFSNPLDKFIYEKAHGWLGDDYINSHTTLETIGALWLAGNVKSAEWISNGLLDVRASAMELLARKLHIWGLYAEGEWDLALRQDTAFNLALIGESSVFGEMIGGPMIMLTRYGLNSLFDAGIPSPESVQKDMLQMGRSIHLGAANSGQQSALAGPARIAGQDRGLAP